MTNRPLPPGPPPGELRREQTVRVSASWEAPLPPPGVFEAYDKTLPGCAARLVRMVEREQEGRIDAHARGQRFAFVLGMTGMICGTILIATGKSVAGLIPLISALLPLVVGFLGRVIDNREREQSLPRPEPPKKEGAP